MLLVGSLLEITLHVLITHFLKAPLAVRGTQVLYSRRQLMTNRRLLYIATYSGSSIAVFLSYTAWKYSYLSLALVESMIGNRDTISCGEEFLIGKEGEKFSVTSPFPFVSHLVIILPQYCNYCQNDNLHNEAVAVVYSWKML